MRIVLVCRVYPTHRPGGMPFVCQDRAEQLAREGHDVHVLTTWKNGPSIEQVDGVTVHYLQVKSMVYSSEFAVECRKACQELEPEVIHLDGFDRSHPWWKERPGNPRVIACTLHGFGMGGFLTRWNLYRVGADTNAPPFVANDLRAEAEALQYFDRVLAISTHEQTLLEDCYGLSNVRLVYNPIAKVFFDLPLQAPPRKRLFLCAAISGHGTRMFRAAEEAAEAAGVRMMVVQDCVRSKMPHKYDEATALVVPTAYAQGYDLTVAESLARNRPVIVAATGSYLREFRAHAWPGACVPIGDVDSMAKAMLGDLPAPKSIVTNGDLVDRHRPERHVRNWLEVLGVAA